ncbi:MAG: MFS transporter [Streptosporangiales bacterium]|nr:MFS transporter [Streptosporangiales bacterium]
MTAERESSTYPENRSTPAATAAGPALIKRVDVRWASLIAFLAWVFAVYDYILFGTLLPAISDSFGWSTSFSTFIATLVAVATFVAALTVGPLMDWIGRARGLVVVTIGAALSSGLTAATFSAWWLVLVRTFSGWGYSEQAVNATYLNELYATVEDSEERSHKRGRTYSYIQGGWPVGVLFASALAAVLLPLVGWRGVFAIATFPAIVIALLARKLKETPQFTNMREVRRLVREGKHEEARRVSEQFGVVLKAGGQRQRRLPLLQVFEREQLQHTVFLCLGFLLNWLGVQVFAVLGTTVLLEAHGISLGSSLVVLIVSNAVAFVGYIVHGIIGDKIGRRETIMGGWILSGLAYALMLFAVDSYAGVFILYTVGLFFLIGPYAALLFYMGESYPTRVRGSGTAMANAMGPIGAILGSALLTGLLSSGFSMTVSAFIAGALTIFLSGLCLLGARRVRPGAPLIEEVKEPAAA